MNDKYRHLKEIIFKFELELNEKIKKIEIEGIDNIDETEIENLLGHIYSVVSHEKYIITDLWVKFEIEDKNFLTLSNMIVDFNKKVINFENKVEIEKCKREQEEMKEKNEIAEKIADKINRRGTYFPPDDSSSHLYNN